MNDILQHAPAEENKVRHLLDVGELRGLARTSDLRCIDGISIISYSSSALRLFAAHIRLEWVIAPGLELFGSSSDETSGARAPRRWHGRISGISCARSDPLPLLNLCPKRYHIFEMAMVNINLHVNVVYRTKLKSFMPSGNAALLSLMKCFRISRRRCTPVRCGSLKVSITSSHSGLCDISHDMAII